jgi:hypothetical protein
MESEWDGRIVSSTKDDCLAHSDLRPF